MPKSIGMLGKFSKYKMHKALQQLKLHEDTAKVPD